MRQCRYTTDFCTCLYGRRVPKGACYGEFSADNGQFIYVCDDYTLYRGALKLHVLTMAEKDVPVYQRYGRGKFLRKAYTYENPVWRNVFFSADHTLSQLILKKVKEYGLVVESVLPDSKQQYKDLRKPMTTSSWTAAGHVKKRECPSVRQERIPTSNGSGHVFSGNKEFWAVPKA